MKHLTRNLNEVSKCWFLVLVGDTPERDVRKLRKEKISK